MNYLNFIPTGVRDRIVEFLVSKAGGALVPVISGAVAVAVSKLTPYLPEAVSTIDQKAVVSFVWLALLSGVNYATNHWLTKDSKAIQSALVKVGADLRVDGVIGDETVREFEFHTGIPVRKAIAIEPADSSAGH